MNICKKTPTILTTIIITNINCFGVLNLSEFYRIELSIPIPSIFILVNEAELTQIVIMPDICQYRTSTKYQHRKPVRDQHWSASAKNRYHAQHIPRLKI